MALIEVNSEVTGAIFELQAHEGNLVQEGDVLLRVESMKMEAPVFAPKAGKLERFKWRSGRT